MADRSDTYGRGNLQWVKRDEQECVARLVVDLPRGADGKRRRKKFTLKGTKRQIEKERTRILHELHEGTIQVDTQQKLADYLAYWLEHAVRPSKAEGTATRAEQYASYYINPALGSVKLSELTPAKIQSFYGRLRTNGRRRQIEGKSAGLSETTINGIHRVLSNALSMAVTWQFIRDNPCKRVAIPKPTERLPVILSREDIALIVQSATHQQLKDFAMIAATTGLRRGEALGLQWGDVNLETGMLAIQHNFVDTGKQLKVTVPKTKSGRRSLRIPAILVEHLAGMKAVQAERKQLLGSAYQDGDLVLCWEDGRPIDPHVLYRPFKRLLKRLGLNGGATLHDIRKSHGTHLLEDNIHPKVVSERLGHADIQTTLNIYSHVLPHIQLEAANAIDKGLRHLLETDKARADEEKE